MYNSPPSTLVQELDESESDGTSTLLTLEMVEAKAKKHICLPWDPLPKPQFKLAQGLFKLLPYMLENMNWEMG
jgi:hypothetical protein